MSYQVGPRTQASPFRLRDYCSRRIVQGAFEKNSHPRPALPPKNAKITNKCL
jgi:hypothetical protein